MFNYISRPNIRQKNLKNRKFLASTPRNPPNRRSYKFKITMIMYFYLTNLNTITHKKNKLNNKPL